MPDLSDERYVANRRELAGGRDLLAEVQALREALEPLLEHAKRIQEHVPKSEWWYAVRDSADAALATTKGSADA